MKPKDRTGTTVEFSPNEKIIGVVDFEYSEILDIVESFSYMVKGLTFKTTIITKKGKEIKKEYCSKNGIVDLLIKMNGGKSMLIPPVCFRHSFGDKEVEVAFTYNTSADEDIISFCNYCFTVQHGTHVTGAKAGITSVISKYIKDNCLTKKEQDIEIKGDDCKNGLVLVVNANHKHPQFPAQIKERVTNQDLIGFVKGTVIRGFNEWIKMNNGEMKTLGNTIKKLSKLREEGNKTRKAAVSKAFDVFDSLGKDNEWKRKYARAENKYDLELYIVEGDSAGGSAKDGRDKRYMEIFNLRGVPKNILGLPLSKVLENVEMNGLVQIIGCGVGKHFDIRKLRYKKIIIMTDSDVDGNRITSLLMLFFLIHMPELVKGGYVYKVIPPLYRIEKGKKGIYLDTKKDYFNMLESDIANHNDVVDVRKGTDLSRAEFTTLLKKNRQYLKTLEKTYKDICINPTLLEYILLYRNESPKKIKKLIESKFRFITCTIEKTKIVIDGMVDGEGQYITLDPDFFCKCVKLLEMFEDNKDHIEYKVNGTLMTLGQMLLSFKKYEPASLTRYKGLGEMNPAQLWETTMDPNARQLLRITVDDIEKEIDGMKVLHDKKEKTRAARKKLLSAFTIDVEDLDN